MLFAYGLSVGVRAVLRGHITRESIKNIIVPAVYWRVLEYRLIAEALRVSSSDRVLDIGSPKLLALYLADRVGAEVYATDIEQYFIRDYAYFRSMLRIEEGRFHVQQADARLLKFENSFFDKIFALTVLQHIPGTGDGEAMKEIARTLRPGGLFAATVPFSVESRDEFRSPKDFYWSGSSIAGGEDGQVFFLRRYSESDIRARLIEPSGLSTVAISYFGERARLRRDLEVGSLLHPLSGPLHPLAAAIFHDAVSSDWRDLRYPCGALLVLKKEQ
jgi:SAM-dependent methyltransferase